MTSDQTVETEQKSLVGEQDETPTIETDITKNFDDVDEISSNRLDDPKIIKGQNGQIAYGTDEGVGKPVNEDAIVINTQANAFAVIDGIGGEGMGEKAAGILAEEIQKGLEEATDYRAIQKNAHLRMKDEGIGSGGACYVLAKIEGQKLKIAQAGDVRLVVIDKDDNLKFGTVDENQAEKGKRNVVTNYVGGDEPGETTACETTLDEGDRIIIASDGLWDNLESQQVANLTEDQPIEVAIRQLNKTAKDRMQKGGKPDNISVMIAHFDHVKVS